MNAAWIEMLWKRGNTDHLIHLFFKSFVEYCAHHDFVVVRGGNVDGTEFYVLVCKYWCVETASYSTVYVFSLMRQGFQGWGVWKAH